MHIGTVSVCFIRIVRINRFHYTSQNELSSPIAAKFCPTNVLALIFTFMLFFLLIGIGQLDNDV